MSIISLKNKWVDRHLADCVVRLATLHKTAFAYYRTVPPSTRLNLQWMKQQHPLWRALSKSSTLGKTARQQKIFAEINHLVEIFFALHQLRFRIIDRSIYGMCAYELAGLKKSSTDLLMQFAKNIRQKKRSVFSTEGFLETIYNFETVNQRALQIAAPRPIVFSFFIQDLYALSEELQKAHDEMA